MNKKAEKIVEATIDLFLEEGVHKISMNQISAHAKASKVTVYKYFEDKDNLYFEIAKYLLVNEAKEYEKIVEEDGSLEEKMIRFLDRVSDFSDQGYYLLCKELARYNLSINGIFTNYEISYKKSMMILINQGINEGIIKSGINAEHVFSYIDMGMYYYQNREDYRYKMKSDKSFREEMMGFLLGNIFVS